MAPKNVIVMTMTFGRLNDGSRKNRLEAQFIGRGTAWISTNGTTIKGTWRKRSMTSTDPLLRCGRQAGHADRRPDVHPGHAAGSKITIKDGKVPKYTPTFRQARDEAL